MVLVDTDKTILPHTDFPLVLWWWLANDNTYDREASLQYLQADQSSSFWARCVVCFSAKSFPPFWEASIAEKSAPSMFDTEPRMPDNHIPCTNSWRNRWACIKASVTSHAASIAAAWRASTAGRTIVDRHSLLTTSWYHQDARRWRAALQAAVSPPNLVRWWVRVRYVCDSTVSPTAPINCTAATAHPHLRTLCSNDIAQRCAQVHCSGRHDLAQTSLAYSADFPPSYPVRFDHSYWRSSDGSRLSFGRPYSVDRDLRRTVPARSAQMLLRICRRNCYLNCSGARDNCTEVRHFDTGRNICEKYSRYDWVGFAVRLGY